MVKYIVFEITGKCNLKCKYCYNAKYTETELKQELGNERILALLHEAKSLGFELAAFSGGEPFLRNELMSLLKASPLPVSVLTNGDLIKYEQIKELSTLSHFKELRFSLDGFQGHDAVRINSNSNRVIEKIRYALSLKIYTSINTMITQPSLFELNKLYQLIKQEFPGIMWRLDVPLFCGRFKEYRAELAIDNELLFKEIQKLIKDYVHDKPDFRIIIANIFKSSLVKKGFYKHSLTEHPCDYAIGSMTVRPNGDVSFCPSLEPAFGNVRQESLNSVLNGKEYQDFSKLQVKDIKGCQECKYLLVCGTGCRADALSLGEGIIGKDPSACVHFKYFEEHILPILPAHIQEEFDEITSNKSRVILDSYG
jgi:radical SAM protein with 4Fe4S-binding SPASM domain